MVALAAALFRPAEPTEETFHMIPIDTRQRLDELASKLQMLRGYL